MNERLIDWLCENDDTWWGAVFVWLYQQGWPIVWYVRRGLGRCICFFVGCAERQEDIGGYVFTICKRCRGEGYRIIKESLLRRIAWWVTCKLWRQNDETEKEEKTW